MTKPREYISIGTDLSLSSAPTDGMSRISCTSAPGHLERMACDCSAISAFIVDANAPITSVKTISVMVSPSRSMKSPSVSSRTQSLVTECLFVISPNTFAPATPCTITDVARSSQALTILTREACGASSRSEWRSTMDATSRVRSSIT